jgi:SAM-dependent methyltransferase
MNGRSDAPLSWIVRFSPLVEAGAPVLDLACGGGRHTRLFLERGHPVTALDVEVSGLADVEGQPGLELVRADLEDGSPWPLPGRRFGAVVVTNYLWRPLFPMILEAVGPGGVLLYETFAQGNEALGRPSDPDFLLRPGELLDLVRGELQVVAYEHGHLEHPRPVIKQRLCAVRDHGPHPLCPQAKAERPAAIPLPAVCG